MGLEMPLATIDFGQLTSLHMACHSVVFVLSGILTLAYIIAVSAEGYS